MNKDIRTSLLTLLLLVAVGLVVQLSAAGGLSAQSGVRQDVYVPLISHGNMGGDPQATTVPAGQRVYGLLGRLAAQRGDRFSHTLTTPQGLVYGLVGESPEMEQQIAETQRSTPSAQVKVWGEVQAGNTLPVIVVTGLLQTEALAATPVPTSAAGPGVGPGVGGAAVPVAIVRFDVVNLHNSPLDDGPRVGAVVKDQPCNIVGRTPDHRWWLLDCADGQTGWIDARLVTVQGSTLDVPIVTSAVQVITPTPQPVPTATPQTVQGWRMSMFSNPYLSGDPVAVADVPEINFNWGTLGPSPRLPVDGFSVRLERRVTFSGGFYRFTLEADDGARLWIDDELVLDAWHGATGQVYSTGRTLRGAHNLRVDYFETSGLAYLRMTTTASSQGPEWDAAYYPGTTPTGNPLVRRQEARGQSYPLDYNWGTGSPAPDELGVDFWSARWTGRFNFDAGNYVFRIRSDDGVRVWLDGQLVIDQWRDGLKEAENRFMGVGGGEHTVTVEYYERSGSAQVRVWWVWESVFTGQR